MCLAKSKRGETIFETYSLCLKLTKRTHTVLGKIVYSDLPVNLIRFNEKVF